MAMTRNGLGNAVGIGVSGRGVLLGDGTIIASLVAFVDEIDVGILVGRKRDVATGGGTDDGGVGGSNDIIDVVVIPIDAEAGSGI